MAVMGVQASVVVQLALVNVLRTASGDAHRGVRQAQAGLASLDTASESLDTLVTFLLIMAILTASVGSMGLAGTMGMNVLERTREIGIMRAIGAVDKVIMRTVIAEGVVIGLLSFGLAIILSVPFTYLLSLIVSLAVFETPIQTVFTITGYLIWLALILVMSAIASVVPMVCIYCGMRFELVTLATGIGSCVPIALPVSRPGDRLHIAAEALQEGLRYF